jgi:hypothetical protein
VASRRQSRITFLWQPATSPLFLAIIVIAAMTKHRSRGLEQMRLNRLLVLIPRLQRELPDPADFWPAFAGLADLIVDAAAPDDHDWIACQINAMLEARGLLVR